MTIYKPYADMTPTDGQYIIADPTGAWTLGNTGACGPGYVMTALGANISCSDPILLFLKIAKRSGMKPAPTVQIIWRSPLQRHLLGIPSGRCQTVMELSGQF